MTSWKAPEPFEGERIEVWMRRVVADMERHVNATLAATPPPAAATQQDADA